MRDGGRRHVHTRQDPDRGTILPVQAGVHDASRPGWPVSTAGATELRRRRRAVLLVGDVLAPGHEAARVVELLHRDVEHESIRGCAVPVVLAGLEEHAVAGADDLYRPAVALHEADALENVDRLPERVGVPRG